MSFLLDTDHLSAHLQRPAGLVHRFVQHSGRLFTPTIALAELYVWAYRRADPGPALVAVDTMIQNEVGVLEFDNDCARTFGRVRTEMRRHGLETATADLLIASVALVHDLILVTHNTSDFEAVPGLRLDDWLTP